MKSCIFVSSVQKELVAAISAEVTARVTAQVTTEVAAQDKRLWDFMVRDISRVFQAAAAQVTAQVTAQVALFCREPKSAREIMEHLQLKHWKTFQENYLNPLIQGELLERTIPDKPNSRLQKYRLTEKARSWLARRKP